MPAVMWFRRDLRLADNPALVDAAAAGEVLPLFVLDPALLKPAGAPRVAFLYRSLRALDAELKARGGTLVVRRGDPVNAVPEVVKEAGASAVHIAADFGPYGSRRDDAERVQLVSTAAIYAPSLAAQRGHRLLAGRQRLAGGVRGEKVHA